MRIALQHYSAWLIVTFCKDAMFDIACKSWVGYQMLHIQWQLFLHVYSP